MAESRVALSSLSLTVNARVMSCIVDGNIGDRRHDFDDDNYLPAPVCLLFLALWPTANDSWWTDPVKPIGVPWFSTLGSGTSTYMSFEGVPTEPKRFSAFLKASRCSFMTCYLHMALALRPGVTSPYFSSYIINWLVEELLDDAARTEQAFVEGRCRHFLWLWTMMIALSAVATATATNKLEEKQMLMWRNAIYEKLRLANSVMDIRGSWETAKQSLRIVAWVDGFDGEEEIRRMWDEAVLDQAL